MNTFVISLPYDTSRRILIEQQLKKIGLDYTIVDAVIGVEKIDDPRFYNDAAAKKGEGRSLRAGEIGCALSHAFVYSEIVRLDLPWALILEDDAILHEDLLNVIKALESGIIRQGDIISLSRCDQYKPWNIRSLIGPYKLVEPFFVREGSIAQTVGYIITQDAAKAIADMNIPVKFPADSWGYYKGKVKFLGVIPTLTLITQNTNLGSTTAHNGERLKFESYTARDLLWHGFKTYNPIGKRIKKLVKYLLKR